MQCTALLLLCCSLHCCCVLQLILSPAACPAPQATLTTEMGGLRSELAEVKARIRAQLEANGEAIAGLHARGDVATRAELEGAAAEAMAAGGRAQA